ncbi:uncharacterized protein IWZ02DRAFT_172009 [Phyllosticta citriasiana]|uniref:Uncharacterized protein n=1 Tax=Phyllosticta citriasiana TaxID=595635 RepID=A0ABR1KHF1_9PEZI
MPRSPCFTLQTAVALPLFFSWTSGARWKALLGVLFRIQTGHEVDWKCWRGPSSGTERFRPWPYAPQPRLGRSNIVPIDDVGPRLLRNSRLEAQPDEPQMEKALEIIELSSAKPPSRRVLGFPRSPSPPPYSFGASPENAVPLCALWD